MPMGSLEHYLFDLSPRARHLEWDTRIKIACGAARGLEYLHCMNDPPVIHRDLKAANILLDESFSSKLSDFGLDRLGPVGDETHVSTRAMGTYGYCAPEYLETGKLTIRSDIYSFGVVLLELITGKKAYDSDRVPAEKNLVNWARQYFKSPKRLLDPKLNGHFPENTLKSLMALCEMCLQEKPSFRPLISDVCVGLEYIASRHNIPQTHAWETQSRVRGEANISYICSRYYRAPELIFGATEYTTSIDIWSAGCVLAELLLGQPLFPGDSVVDQLVEIIKRSGAKQLAGVGYSVAMSSSVPVQSVPLDQQNYHQMPDSQQVSLERELTSHGTILWCCRTDVLVGLWIVFRPSNFFCFIP